MKPLLLTLCSDHFLPLLQNHFLASLESSGNAELFDLHIEHLTPRFSTFDTAAAKGEDRKGIELVRRIIAANLGRRIVWSDVDVRFYRRIPLDDLHAATLFCARDRIEPSPVFCTGLQVFTASRAIIAMYDHWLAIHDEERFSNVQWAFNEAIEAVPHQGLSERYWTIGLGDRDRHPWEAGDRIPKPPADIVWHHGNFTCGLDNKLALLEGVRQIFATR